MRGSARTGLLRSPHDFAVVGLRPGAGSYPALPSLILGHFTGGLVSGFSTPPSAGWRQVSSFEFRAWAPSGTGSG